MITSSSPQIKIKRSFFRTSAPQITVFPVAHSLQCCRFLFFFGAYPFFMYQSFSPHFYTHWHHSHLPPATGNNSHSPSDTPLIIHFPKWSMHLFHSVQHRNINRNTNIMKIPTFDSTSTSPTSFHFTLFERSCPPISETM